MSRPTLSHSESRRIRERLERYIAERWQEDWSALWTVFGLPRSTVIRWRESNYVAPDAAHLVKLAQRGLSLDWLLAGVEPMERQADPTGESPAERVRDGLVAEYFASELPQTITLVGGPLSGKKGEKEVVLPAGDAADWNRALPPADTLFRLAREFIRPLAREAAVIVAERKWRRGRWTNDEKVVAAMGMKACEAREREDEAQFQEQLQVFHERCQSLAVHLEERHRKGRVGYQVVTDRSMLAPFDAES